MQFAKVAHATDFLYCYSIIESNRRSDYAPESQQSTGTKSRPVIHPAIVGSSMHAELNTFFPFDPYKLPKSSTYIQDVYREWASVAIDDDDEDDDSEEEEDAEEEEDNESEHGWAVPRTTPPKQDDTDGLGASFGGMSISPARPTISVSVTMAMSVS